MTDRKEISSELSAISNTVAELPFKPVFTVPEGYFHEFPEKLMKMIREEENSDVRSELEQISPLLASLERKTPFTVPDGYFSQLEHDLLPEKEHIPAKVVEMYRPGRLRVWYSAAAVTAILGLFTWFYLANNGNETVQPETVAVNLNAELPQVSETEINSYLATIPENIQVEPLSLAGVEEADFDEILNEINENELQQFINENPAFKIDNMN
ncbi:MAG TPA: hypothetical protein VFX73_00125 [Chitinophagaceae bacterium]|nr:hypothetical protein [Chitinophagaceae bacterium]